MALTAADFEPEPADPGRQEAISRPSLGYWLDAWWRLKRNRLALVGLVILAAIIALAVFAPMLSPYRFSDQSLLNVSQPPSAQFWLGTDDLGRDIWTRLWVGGRISLFIGVAAASLDLLIGALYGGIAGYAGGWVDDVLMRIVEVIYGIPYLLLVILLMVILGSGIGTIILAMALTGWVGMARLVRGQVLQLRNQEFILAARTLGAGPRRLVVRHLIPNAIGPVLVYATLTVRNAIFTEAILSFIGLGVPLPMASWGSLANTGYTFIRIYPWMLVFPATAIGLAMLAFNLFGDGLRDALDPRLRT